MQIKKQMTRHAWDRWLERFDEFDLNAELAAAIPWGGQKHGDESWLAPCGAVFIVSGSNVRTVLTRTQALANMQQFVRGALLNELAATPSPRPAIAPVEIEPEEEEFSDAKLKQIATEHATRHSWKSKHAKTELREAGFDPGNPKQMEIYRDAYFAERRRLLGAPTSKVS